MKFIKYYNSVSEENSVSRFAEKFNLDKTVIEIIMSRGYQTEENIRLFLQSENLELRNPFDLNNMQKAVDIINKFIKENKKILIFGDYDVDGISATTIMIKTLAKLGCNASYFLPNRYVDGYGLTVDVIDKIKKTVNPDLIITVDCGISCFEEVEYCKKSGIEIIVTDHHELPEILPDCTIINAKIPNQKYNFAGLCGTGVAFEISKALLGMGAQEFLPITAIATIADIVPLVDENRKIVKKGLSKMQACLPYGIKQLFKENKIALNKMEASDIAFKIAPKLNACGRMGEAEIALELFFENNPIKVKELLNKITIHNSGRQELCSKVYEDCKKQLCGKNMSNMPAIILYGNDWDHGILGIVCSKLLEEFNRPVFLFSKDEGLLKGSARSINDINIHHILSSIKDILEVFGGHTMAAGLTLKESNLDEFIKRINAYIYENISDKVFVPIDYYDKELTSSEISSKLIEDLKVLEPCGCENSKPKFLIQTDKLAFSPLKKCMNHANVFIGKNLNLIYFNFLNNQAKLNFGKKFKFIFEFQEGTNKYNKGIVKNFDCTNDIKISANKYLESFVVTQLAYKNNSGKAKFNIYSPDDMVEFLMDCSSSVFGNAFVTFNINTYLQFIEKFDTSNIYDFNFASSLVTGFNSIFICPQNLDFVTSYKNIIFLDAVMDTSYLAKINEMSDANIYIPSGKKYAKTLLGGLNLERSFFANIFSKLTRYQNNQFISIFGVYSAIIKENDLKFNFNNFIVPFYVFKELGILNIINENGFFKFTIDKNIKSELTNSSIFNTLKLLKNLT